MSQQLVIGEFSRATHLTVKALRHYHELGLLVPVEIDPDSGYRYYDGSQVARAQLIRRLREMKMPLAEIEAVIDSPSVAQRDQAVALHLERMEAELERTRDVVGALRDLLTTPPEAISPRWESVPEQPVFALTATVERADVEAWCINTFPGLFGAAIAAEVIVESPAGALFSGDFFEKGAGEVTAFVPVSDATAVPNIGMATMLPAAHLGIAEHTGSYATLDRTYGALAQAIAETGLGLTDEIREYYRVSVNDSTDPDDYRTDVCWPVSEIPTAA